METGFRKKYMNWDVEISHAEYLAAGETRKAYSVLFQAHKNGTFESIGVLDKGDPNICVRSTSQCKTWREDSGKMTTNAPGR